MGATTPSATVNRIRTRTSMASSLRLTSVSMFAPAGARPRVRPMHLDQARRHVDEVLSFRRLQRRQDSLVGGAYLGQEATPQFLAARRQEQLPCAPVVGAGRAREQAALLEAV